MKAMKFTFLAAAVVSSFVLCSGSMSWGNYYQKGRHICEDFQRAKQNYRANPESLSFEIAYAACLVIRDQGSDASEGMRHMHRVADRHNHVFAALFIAEYIETDGRFTLPIDIDKIDEAIHAYFRVGAIINREPGYPHSKPINYFVYEKYDQMELRAYHRIPQLYGAKYNLGFYGLYNKNLMTSASYKGKRNLPTYSKYSPYTQDSLIRAIQSADRCSNLPKKRHFKPNYHEFYRKNCGILKELALALQPMEEKRLVLLNTESCRRDLPNCKEYNELHKRIEDIMIQKSSEINALSDAYDLTIF